MPTSGPATTAAPRPAGSLEAAVVGYTTALHTGATASASGWLSTRCQQVFGAQFGVVVQRATNRMAGGTPVVSAVRSTVVGDRAFVSYSVAGGSSTFSPVDEPWVRTASGWRMDGCN